MLKTPLPVKVLVPAILYPTALSPDRFIVILLKPAVLSKRCIPIPFFPTDIVPPPLTVVVLPYTPTPFSADTIFISEFVPSFTVESPNARAVLSAYIPIPPVVPSDSISLSFSISIF